MEKPRYPIGVQSFEEIRRGEYVYVDKTEFIYRLLKGSKYYFLGRPRRFGKSLFLSTLKAFFLGKRDLFNGLALASKPDVEWREHPVIHIDLNGKDYSSSASLDEWIGLQLSEYEKIYGFQNIDNSIEARFFYLIKSAHLITGAQVVVLIDEYDKPILDSMHSECLSELFRNKLRSFYSILKSADEHLRFAMLTGVTKFGHLNIFSGLNNLRDISLSEDFAGVCGVSYSELVDNFHYGINALADSNGVSYGEALTQLRDYYDGYHFSRKSPDIYNPFSLLNCLEDETFRNYWFQTGTPSFVINLLRNRNYRLSDLDGVECDEGRLYGIDVAASDPVPVLYQSGYLSIKSFDSRFRSYRLGFPNKEVADGFFNSLIEFYSGAKINDDFVIREFVREIENGEVEGFLQRLKSFFSSISYDMRLDREVNFQNVVYVIFRLLNFYTDVEVKTSQGRIDILVQTFRYVYIMELKMDSSPREALRQIKDREYSDSYRFDAKTVFEIGVNFSSKTRTLSGWMIESCSQ